MTPPERRRRTQKQLDRNRAKRASSTQDQEHYSSGSYEPGGASCFTLNIRDTRMPKGFKFTAEIAKFDGMQDPSSGSKTISSRETAREVTRLW